MTDDFDTQMLSTARELSDIGMSLHWLHRKQKRPKGDDWQNRAFQNFGQLSSGFVSHDNLGVRLGEPSHMVDGSYLHVIDADIRVPALREEALAALHELLGNTDALPMVRSGSGGESFHLYFVSDKPFRSKKLAQSDGKFRGPEGSWHRDWELELFGTGKQVVLPPSIHPCGKPYRWEREFDEFTLQFDDSYQISSDVLARLAVPDDATYEYETVSPLDFKAGRMESLLDDLPVSDLDYDDWIRLGQALHHQLGGTEEGFQLWLKHTERSEKHDHKPATVRTMRMKWRSFGKYRGRPVTMATISQWASEARLDALADEFDELEDLEDDSVPAQFDHLFDSDSTVDAGSGDGDTVRGKDTSDSDESDPFTPEPGLKWQSLLDLTEKGGLKDTLHNVTLIIENDSRTKGVIRYNSFAEKLVQHQPVGTKKRKREAKPTLQLTGSTWTLRDSINGDHWDDKRDTLLRRILEAPTTQGGYGFKVSKMNLGDAITNVGVTNSFHPVRDYLKAVKWDGKQRMETLFIDYIKTPDNSYYRSIARLFLIAAVARVFEPAMKFDYVPIIEGMQGRRKSTFIKVLGKHWSSELDGDFADDRAMIEKMLGSWISELPELSAFNKAEVNHIKAFVSRQEDRARLAYDRRVTIFQRQCVFMGSTNDRKYLKDETGGRRFWPVECNMTMNEEIDTERLELEIDQIWAEAYQAYLAMRVAHPHGTLPLYLRDKKAVQMALALQESRRVENATDNIRGIIEEWLDRPMFSGDIADGEPKQHDRTCAMQLWVECFKGDMKNFPYQNQTAINKALRSMTGWTESGQKRFKVYGAQKAYVREGSVPTPS